jgi:hypothetical protein
MFASSWPIFVDIRRLLAPGFREITIKGGFDIRDHPRRRRWWS